MDFKDRLKEIKNIGQLINFLKKNPITELIEYFVKVVLIWRIKHIELKNFILVLSILVGFFSGIGAVTMKTGVHFVESLINKINDPNLKAIIYLFLPVLGLLTTVFFFRNFVKKNYRIDLKKVLFSISRKRGNIPFSGVYSSVVGSSITVGSGCSVGLEAPIVSTGASIGSWIGKIVRLGHRPKILLIGCGVAGGISGVFNTPITGIIFTLEILMFDLSVGSVIPLLLASVAGTLTTKIFLGDGLILKFPQQLSYNVNEVPFFIIMGILAGLSSLYLTRTKKFFVKKFLPITNEYKRAIIGGMALSLMFVMFPTLKGEGYLSIKESFNLNPFGWIDISNLLEQVNFTIDIYNPYIVFIFLLAIFLFKAVASGITIASGGEGGIIAPSLAMGSMLGLLFYTTLNFVFPKFEITYTAYILLGMAGLISGAFHAPLTSIFLIAEATSSYELLVPLIIVSSFSFLLVKYFEKHSIYTAELAQKNQLLSHDKDSSVLSMLNINHIVDKNIITVDYDEGIDGFLEIVKTSNNNFYPVIDKEKNFYGIIYFEDVKEVLFQKDKKNFVSLITSTPSFIKPNETSESVSKKFEKINVWYLPYLDNGKYMGMVSKSKFLDQYRNILKKMSFEHYN